MLRHCGRASRIVALAVLVACSTVAQAGPPGLELRRMGEKGLEEGGQAVPADAVRVYVYAGQPRGVAVGEENIAVDFGHVGVMFRRTTGQVRGRCDAADGWYRKRPEVFGPARADWPAKPPLAGPGVVPARVGDENGEFQTAAETVFQGRSWRALQPPRFIWGLIKDSAHAVRREKFGTWTSILGPLNEQCYVQAGDTGDTAPARRFTMADGLASNIVTRFAVAQGSLWAACVDIWDTEAGDWGPGGLCRFDAAADRWQRIDKIDGRPVRWVTLLETVGDELWVGFREGRGIEDDSIVYGMGISVGHYRPKATALVLARLAGGKWTTFSRPLLPDLERPWARPEDEKPAPSETPRTLAVSGQRVILFSKQKTRRPSYNWEYEEGGQVSVLDLASGKWTTVRPLEDLGVDELVDMVVEKGEILLVSNRGVHQWVADGGSWRMLDPGCRLRNSSLSAVVPVGDELWVGYGKEGFGRYGLQGISRISETTGEVTTVPPEAIGTGHAVRAIAPLPGGEVWVLFAWNPMPMTAAVEFPYYPWEAGWNAPQGLARCSGGKWEFPARAEGLPEHLDRVPRGSSGWFPIRTNLVALGNRLFLSAGEGLFAGPGQWKKVVDGPVPYVEPSADGKTVVMVRRVAQADGGGESRIERGSYDPASGKATFETLAGDEAQRWQGVLQGWDRADRDEWIHSWVRLPTAGGEAWAVGPLGGAEHRIIRTPHAVWLASTGELIRLDRKRLGEHLGD